MVSAAKIFQSGMVLQRDLPFRIWGTADPGVTVSISFQGCSTAVPAEKDGSWSAVLPAPKTSLCEEIVISAAGSACIRLTDVAVGEVWIAAGQSNMEFWMKYEKHFQEELSALPNSRLRFCDVPKIAYDGQESDFDYSRVGRWRQAAEGDIGYFSAVGYYFQKSLAWKLDVPVGIIGCNWGGTSICAWLPAETVSRRLKSWYEHWTAPFDGLDMEEYWREVRSSPASDTGNPLENDFNNFLLPGTPGREEILASPLRDVLNPDPGGKPGPFTIPGSLYEHMTKTIAPFSVRGVLWYQGETDDIPGGEKLYREALTALVSDWRTLWQQDGLPFLVVQLPGWESWLTYRNGGFVRIRQDQQDAACLDNRMFLCSISDAGERYDIHPKDKKVVGERLALLALGHIYGWNLLCDAPELERAERCGSRVVIHFRNAPGGLTVRGKNITALQVLDDAGEVPFRATADGESVVLELLRNTGKVQIQYARTAWYATNLYNLSGIPALPFCVEC